MSNPVAIAVDGGGNLYIVDTWNNRIRKVDSSSTITRAGTGFAGILGDGGAATSARVNEPEGIALDNSGNVYIADYGNSKIRKIDVLIINTIAGTGATGYSGDGEPAAAASLNLPTGVAVDGHGDVYIAATRIAGSEEWIPQALSPQLYGPARPESTRFFPEDVAVDAQVISSLLTTTT